MARRDEKRQNKAEQARELLPFCQSDAETLVLNAVIEHGGHVMDAVRALGLAERNVRKRFADVANRAEAAKKIANGGIDLPDLPSSELPYDEIREKRLREFERKQAHHQALELVTARVRRKGPIALFFFGDPHLDDPGTDLKTLYEHTELIKQTDGMYACNIGDTTNNWVGRLKALYAEQSTTQSEAWTLAEGWIHELAGKWLFLIGGNHDYWSGSGDPLKWFTKAAGAHYVPHRYRVKLKFPNGAEVVVNSRHDWPGHSQWNPTHGPLKAAELGHRDDVYVAGHKHISGYQNFKAGDGSIIHAARVASYKIYDEYATQRGFRDHTISPCLVFVIDPTDDTPDRIKHFWCPYRAAQYLKFLEAV